MLLLPTLQTVTKLAVLYLYCIVYVFNCIMHCICYVIQSACRNPKQAVPMLSFSPAAGPLSAVVSIQRASGQKWPAINTIKYKLIQSIIQRPYFQMDLQGEGENDSTAHRIDTMLEEGRRHPAVDEPPSIVSYCIKFVS